MTFKHMSTCERTRAFLTIFTACALIVASLLPVAGCSSSSAIPGTAQLAASADPDADGTSSQDTTLTAKGGAPCISQQLTATEDTPSSIDVSIPQSTLKRNEIPASYYDPADQQGTVQAVYYDTHDYYDESMSEDYDYQYDENGDETKDALVYLPYGYDPDDDSTRYDIVYIMHGSGGDETDYMSDVFRNILDHMIEDGLMAPMIVVSPTIEEGSDAYVTSAMNFQTELTSDLIPAVEGRYHTYADSTSPGGLVASRSHRAFAGFSLGAMVTWDTFVSHLDSFEYFVPISCDYVDMTSDVYYDAYDGLTSEESTQVVIDAAANSGYTPRQYFIFAAGGTDDYLCDDLYAQLEVMKTRHDLFVWTDSFDTGNVMFYLAQGGEHSYWYSFEYLYNGLQQIFHEEG